MAIRIFITGGTFDKEYNELNGQLYFKDTHMSDLLELGRCRVKVEIRTLMMIDSLEMTDQDRELIIHQCNNCEESKIVITHGTDTMADTAKEMGQTQATDQRPSLRPSNASLLTQKLLVRSGPTHFLVHTLVDTGLTPRHYLGAESLPLVRPRAD